MAEPTVQKISGPSAGKQSYTFMVEDKFYDYHWLEPKQK